MVAWFSKQRFNFEAKPDLTDVSHMFSSMRCCRSQSSPCSSQTLWERNSAMQKIHNSYLVHGRRDFGK